MPRTRATPPRTAKRVRDEIRDRLLGVARDRVVAIVLFGSRAAGKEHPRSDWDVAVVLQEPVDDWVEETRRLARIFYDAPFAVDLHVIGEAEWQEDAVVPGTLPYTLARKGELLYEDHGHARRAPA